MDYYIVLSSITYATWLKKQLNSVGLSVGLVQTPKCIATKGCSYALKTTEKKVDTAIRIADENKIKIRGIYCKDSEGNFINSKRL